VGGGRKENILKSKEDGSTLHIYIRRQHNETHQTLFERVGKGKARGEYNAGCDLVQGTLYVHMEL
jgi:hypothetical protein